MIHSYKIKYQSTAKEVAEGQKQHDTVCIYCEICKQYIVYMHTYHVLKYGWRG